MLQAGSGAARGGYSVCGSVKLETAERLRGVQPALFAGVRPVVMYKSAQGSWIVVLGAVHRADAGGVRAAGSVKSAGGAACETVSPPASRGLRARWEARGQHGIS